MRIGVVGSGNIGGTAARLLADAGHDVVLSNARGPESLRDEEGERLRAGTVAEAAEHGEVVIVAIPLHAYRDLPADPFAGRVVVDAMNYYSSRDGRIGELDRDETTSTELLAAHLPGARVVKALNTLRWSTLRDGGRPPGDPERLALLVAGDDADAKAVVSGLLGELGFDPVDTGSLAEGGRLQQPGGPGYAALTAQQARELLR
jgi:8-hydroxy-5-deazaflavin:NADPH oxidoreductase